MSGVQSGVHDVDVDLGKLFSCLARDKWRILGVSLAVTALALVYATLVDPKYRAETRVLIETRESVFTRPGVNGESEGRILDEEGVLSQVEVITSTDLLRRVAADLDLASLSEFDGVEPQSALERGLVAFGLRNQSVATSPEERVLKEFRERLTVYRIDRSRVIVIQFSSEDPALAAKVPNAIAETYLAVQRDAKRASNTDATGWLKPEIDDLRKRVMEAEARVAEYRSSSDLLIGRGDTVLATQQLSELSSELSRVRANLASAEAKAKSVRMALDRGAAVETIPDVLASNLIQRLRERQVQLKAEIAELSTTLLDGHPRIKALRAQLADYDSQIRNEARKVLESLESETETARLREQQLVNSVNVMKVQSARAGEQEVELRALEREAASQRELLESYMTRYREAASRKERNYLPADARIFSRAIAPSAPYFPKKAPIVGAAFAGSLLIMVIVSLLRELFSGRAMIERQQRETDTIEQIVMTPVAGIGESGHVAAAISAGSRPDEGPGGQAGDENGYDPSGHRVDRVAEMLVAKRTNRVVTVSPEGDEGAAVSILLAREIADAGLRVLLLDLTESGTASKPMLDSMPLPGITNLLASEAQFSDVIHCDHYSDCHIIPAGTADPARAMRGVERLPIIMESLTTAYDTVIVECGHADTGGLRRLITPDTAVLVSVIDPANDAIVKTMEELREGGIEDALIVSPLDYFVPPSPDTGRTAA